MGAAIGVGMATITAKDLKRALKMVSDDAEIVVDYMSEEGDLCVGTVYSLETGERYGYKHPVLILWAKEKA